MGTTIVLKKEHLVKKTYNGAIKESKVLGFPQENSPVKPYSNIFYWTNLASDFGSVITEHPIIGFEILTYVLKGTYETFDKDKGQLVKMIEGDMQLIQAGKGIRYSGKLHPKSEIIQVWIDPDLNQSRRTDPVLVNYAADILQTNNFIESNSKIFSINNEPIKLNSKNVEFQVLKLGAGFHTIPSSKDNVLSGYVVEGFIEIDDTLMGVGDFFKVENKKELHLASLINSKIFTLVSPLKPEYQTYAELQF